VRGALFFLQLILARLDVAISTIYRLVAAWLEGYFSLFATLRAGGGEHLPWSTAHAAAISKALGSPILPAGRASLRFIGVAFGSEEFLLFCGEGKGIAAIGALE
jgi:hypothetical protein